MAELETPFSVKNSRKDNKMTGVSWCSCMYKATIGNKKSKFSGIGSQHGWSECLLYSVDSSGSQMNSRCVETCYIDQSILAIS